MIDNLKSMAVFAIVVEERSFSKAAVRLALSPSVISHHVSQLEQRLGAALIYRSTRSFSLSEEGHRFYKSTRAMLDAATEGLSRFSTSDTVLTQLRIAMPQMLSLLPLFQRVLSFAQQNPGLQLTYTSSDVTKDLVSENIDVAIRIGRLKDSELKVRKIGEGELLPVVSPAYSKTKDKPKNPTDLKTWKHISFTPVPNEIVYRRSGSSVQRIWGETSAVTDSVQVMHSLACAGMGVAGLPDELVQGDLKSGVLKRILPNWRGQRLDYFIVWHKNISAGSATRDFIDHMCGK
jgi:DNA-binding transcriptional LysR family regulator